VADEVLTAAYAYTLKPGRFRPPAQVRGSLLDYLGAPDPDRALGAFRRILLVDRNPKTGLLTVTAETRSPELSMQVVRNAVEELRRTLVGFNQAEGRSRAGSVSQRLAEVQALYKARAEAFQGFQDRNRNWEASASPSIRFQGNQMKGELDLWRQVIGNLTLNQEQALLEARNEAQSLLVLDPGGLPRAKSRPHRGFIVFGAMVLAGTTSWAIQNRSTIHHFFVAKGKP
jgi:hypothetical protein